MQKTKIDYLKHTWNPITMRCNRVSEACDHCWHLRRADMLAKNPVISSYRRSIYAGNASPAINLDEIDAPWNMKKPSIIGVQFMGDLFHESIDFNYGINRIFEEMENAVWHTFVILTKRPKRMLEYHRYLNRKHGVFKWPDNIWIGVTVEKNDYLDRIGYLLQMPVNTRFISFEPLLGPIDASHYLFLDKTNGTREHFLKHGWGYDNWSGGFFDKDSCYNPQSGIQWIIVGGESGHRARPMHANWVRSIRDQCQEAKIPFFFKQWGEFIPGDQIYKDIWNPEEKIINKAADEILFRKKENPSRLGYQWIDGAISFRVGKKASSNILDGHKWNEYPIRKD